MAGKVEISRTTVFLILAIAAALIGGFLIYVQVGMNRALKEAALTEQRQLAQAQVKLARYQQLRDHAPVYRAQLAVLKRMIPAAPGEEALIREIYYLADDAKLRVTEIRFGNRVEKDAYIELPLVITLEGRYQGLLKTLSHLRSGDRAIRVDDLRVSNITAGVRVTISANAFYNKADYNKAD